MHKPTTEPRAAASDVASIEADLQSLQAQIQGMEQDLAALHRTMASAKRTHCFALALSLAVAVTAAWMGLSDWLRYYLFPLTLALVLLFTLGTRAIAQGMSRKILALQQFADHAMAQLQTAKQMAVPPQNPH